MTEEQQLYFLQCLEGAGVDNWDGYYYAFQEYLKKYPEVDDDL